MAKGLGLDASNDIIIGSTQFGRISGGDYVAQKIRSSLQLIYGESVLDGTAGIAYFDEVFVKPVDLAGVCSIFKTAIIDVDGVNELLSFDYSLDTTQRVLSISFTVSTDYDDIDISDLTLNIGA